MQRVSRRQSITQSKFRESASRLKTPCSIVPDAGCALQPTLNKPQAGVSSHGEKHDVLESAATAVAITPANYVNITE